jgi:hypothetical protein
MSYVKDLDASKPTDIDAVADGAGEIREVKDALKTTFPQANTALTVSNEAINEAIKTEIPSLDSRLNALDGGVAGGGSAIAASCKYNSVELKYAHNISKVEMPAPGQGGTQYASCRVTFANQIPDFDNHYAIIIQPYATSANNTQVIATVNNQNSAYVEFVWATLKDGNWAAPLGPPAFSLIVVDYEQRPGSA